MRRSRNTVAVVASIIALAQAGPAASQGLAPSVSVDSMPNGIAGERIRSFIDVFNDLTPARFARHVRDDFTEAVSMRAAEGQQAYERNRRDWGSIRFRGVYTAEPPDPSQALVLFEGANFDQLRAVWFRFDQADEGRISGLQFRNSAPVGAEPDISRPELVPTIHRLVTRACELDLFSGAVLVAESAEVLYSHACGEASKRFHVPNTLRTRFNLGSMNKMFTSLAIMQLVEQGVVALDDPISRYVDETWLPKEMTDRITIHHLLTHTSGLGNYFNDTYWSSSRELFRALDDYKPLIRGERLAFEPGTDWAYSNTGMFLLGVVLETATGTDYFEYIRQNVYQPAGMVASDSYEMDQPVENLAIGYDRRPDGAYENNLYKHVIKGGPAGGGFSTVEDLHRFALTLEAGRLVSPESLDLMWTDQAGAGYGYGFQLEEIERVGRVVGHEGGFPGISSKLEIMPDRNLVVVVMSNYGGAARIIVDGINALVARTAVTPH